MRELTTSRQHQQAHGIGQIEQQLNNQADAAEEIQGKSKLDQEVQSAAQRKDSELDEIIEL